MSENTVLENPKVRVIRKSEDFIVEGVGKVTISSAIHPEVAEQAGQPMQLFHGFALIAAQIGENVRQFPVEWQMSGATNLDEAFDVFYQQATETFKQNIENARQQAESERNRIIKPS